MGKFLERIIKQRTKKEITMSQGFVLMIIQCTIPVISANIYCTINKHTKSPYGLIYVCFSNIN